MGPVEAAKILLRRKDFLGHRLAMLPKDTAKSHILAEIGAIDVAVVALTNLKEQRDHVFQANRL